MPYSQYKVIEVSEGGCSTLIFGGAKLPLGKIEDTLNQHASEGWNVVFQVVDQKKIFTTLDKRINNYYFW